ncbi:MAG: hypothetical protein GF364_02895 [Candidatus Lokiarchaeota archaeon]|nr:hypothetical protein [Candidatus Lokiarchaeota archaeon]
MKFNLEKSRKGKINYFGIGLNKTGLTSLTTAFGMLGYRAYQAPNDHVLSRLKNFDFICDIPIWCEFKKYDKKYPGSKFIYTFRPLKPWLKSRKNSFKKIKKMRKKTKRLQKKIKQAYGSLDCTDEKLIKIYKKHHIAVMDYFKNRNDFLFIEICNGEGWEKLCPFTKEKIPNKPFPQTRKS